MNCKNFDDEYIYKKRRPKFTINKEQKLLIKRTISKLKERKNKVNATKLKNECDLNVSVTTIQRHMKRSRMKYKKISSQIYLSHNHKEDRLTKVSSWVTENHVWEKLFSVTKNGSVWMGQTIGVHTFRNTKILVDSEDNAGEAVLWFG